MKRNALEGASQSLGSSLEFMRGLWELNHALERLSSRMSRTLGITAQQRLMIRCIGTVPQVTASGLADLLHVDRSTVSASLKRLEARGFVARRRDESDARLVVLALTARGQKLNRAVPGTVESVVARVIRGHTKRDIASTTRVLSELSRLARAEAQR